MRAGLLDLDEQIDRSYDRYAFVRNAWLQRREFQVTDGDIEDPSLELEEGMEDRRTAPDADDRRAAHRRPGLAEAQPREGADRPRRPLPRRPPRS